MRRRELIASAVALVASSSRSQPAELPLVGALLVNITPEASGAWRRILGHLRALGYIDGSTVRYTARASEQPERLAELAAELIRLNPQVIYANGDAAAKAVAAVSTSIPVVAMTDDHVGAGLTDSLARPSRNITGISRLEADLDTKRLELLHELVPAAAVVLAIRDPQTAFANRTAQLEQAASKSGLKLQVRDAWGAGDIEEAVVNGQAAGAKAVLVLGSPLLTSFKVDDQIIYAAAVRHLPTMVQLPYMVKRGHLAGYGPDQDALEIRLAYMIDRILKGTAPGTIPIEQPAKFEFVINLKTAKALGLTVSPSILDRANEVIE